MSVTGLLKQISSYSLSRVKETPSLLNVFQGVETLGETPKIDNLYGLSSEYANLIREILPNPEQIVGEWTLWDFETLAIWKAEYPKDFDKLKTDLYQIVTEGKIAPTLYLGKGWHIISYLLTGISFGVILPFLVDDTENNLKVNAILCGQPLDEDRSLRYLEDIQVREIAEALSRISEEVIYQRFAQGLSTRKNTYLDPFFWITEDYEGWLALCFKVRAFYSSAAHRENAMLISIV